jgi:hypothetical protein
MQKVESVNRTPTCLIMLYSLKALVSQWIWLVIDFVKGSLSSSYHPLAHHNDVWIKRLEDKLVLLELQLY